jgi:hypothetical protein
MPAAQFCCEPKTAPKNQVYYTGDFGEWMGHSWEWNSPRENELLILIHIGKKSDNKERRTRTA